MYDYGYIKDGIYVCPECGKEFYVEDLSHWVYKLNFKVRYSSGDSSKYRPLCSYTCYTHNLLRRDKEQNLVKIKKIEETMTAQGKIFDPIIIRKSRKKK